MFGGSLCRKCEEGVVQVDEGPGLHWCTCSPSVLGTSQLLGLVALEGIQHPGSSPWGRTPG